MYYILDTDRHINVLYKSDSYNKTVDLYLLQLCEKLDFLIKQRILIDNLDMSNLYIANTYGPNSMMLNITEYIKYDFTSFTLKHHQDIDTTSIYTKPESYTCNLLCKKIKDRYQQIIKSSPTKSIVVNENKVINIPNNKENNKDNINNDSVYDIDKVKAHMNALERYKLKEEDILTKKVDDLHKAETDYCEVESELQLKKLNKKLKQEKEENRIRIFNSDKNITYKRIKEDIMNGDVKEDDIPPMFIEKYPIFKYMDERNHLDNENAINIYDTIYKTIYGSNNDVESETKYENYESLMDKLDVMEQEADEEEKSKAVNNTETTDINNDTENNTDNEDLQESQDDTEKDLDDDIELDDETDINTIQSAEMDKLNHIAEVIKEAI